MFYNNLCNFLRTASQRSHHKPSPKHIVNCNDASLPQKGQAQLKVAVVVLLKIQYLDPLLPEMGHNPTGVIISLKLVAIKVKLHI